MGEAVQKLSEENQSHIPGHDLCGPCEFTAEHVSHNSTL